MLNKLKSILPEKRKIMTNHIRNRHENKGYDECLIEIEALLPDMLALIREEIEKGIDKFNFNGFNYWDKKPPQDPVISLKLSNIKSLFKDDILNIIK